MFVIKKLKHLINTELYYSLYAGHEPRVFPETIARCDISSKGNNSVIPYTHTLTLTLTLTLILNLIPNSNPNPNS